MESIIKKEKSKIFVKYVPHGINENEFKKVDVPDSFKNQILGNNKFDFVFFWSNRNIRRKQPSDVIAAFSEFCDNIGKKASKKVALILHTNPVDENGTDLPAVIDSVAPNTNIIFSTKKLNTEELNYLYNLSDVTINIAGNEGFGLTTAESVMAETPIIVNVTGGLQDQCGFRYKETNELVVADDYIELKSLHDLHWKDKLTWGQWVYPVWSRVKTLTGSVPTPYIWDDKVNISDVAEAMMYWYHLPKKTREMYGKAGRNSFNNELGLSVKNMCDSMADGIESVIRNFKSKPKYELYKLK